MSHTPASNTSTVDSVEGMNDRRWDILHWAKLSSRYHAKRQWFFHGCDTLTQLICTVAGLAIFSTFFTTVWIAGAVVSILSVLALIVRYNDCKQRHIELGRRCQHLVADIEAIPKPQVTVQMLSDWGLRRANINSDEPASIRTLVSLCEWEQAQEDGAPNHVPKLTRWELMHCHLW